MQIPSMFPFIPYAMLKVSRGGDSKEFVSDLAKLIVMSGSAFGAAAFVQQSTAVAVSLTHPLPKLISPVPLTGM